MYSASEIQAISIRARCCASSLGIGIFRKKSKGLDCKKDQINLRYLLRAQKVISRYPSSAVATNVSSFGATATFTISATPQFTEILLTIDGVQVYNIFGPFASASLLIDAMLTHVNANSVFTIVKTSSNTFIVYSPHDVVWNGVDVVFSINAITPPKVITTHSFSGAITATFADQGTCLTEVQADKIIQNIFGICGCMCGCNDYLNDTTPETSSGVVISPLSPGAANSTYFKFYTIAGQVAYTFTQLANCAIDALDYGTGSMPSAEYTLVSNSTNGTITFNFDPSLILSGTEINLVKHPI